jgi:hypothetical protein
MHEADDPLVVLAAARARFLAQERESARPALRAGRTELDERWPVSYALRFILMVSIGLWAVIMAAASWLLG